LSLKIVPVSSCHNIKNMISATLFTTGVLVKKAILLLLLNLENVPEMKVYSDWLKDDKFKKDHSKDPSKKHLFAELDRLKKKYWEDWNGEYKVIDGVHKQIHPMTEDGSRELTPGEIKIAFDSKELQISRVRHMIEHEYSVIKNLHKPSGVKYVVVRSYWFDRNGSKVKKFNKNLGAEDKITVNGEIPKSLLTQGKKEIDEMMWEYYKNEYGLN
jgi:hypothetical protein